MTYRSIYDPVLRLRKRSGVAFWHKYATGPLRRGVSVAVVSKLLGKSSPWMATGRQSDRLLARVGSRHDLRRHPCRGAARTHSFRAAAPRCRARSHRAGTYVIGCNSPIYPKSP